MFVILFHRIKLTLEGFEEEEDEDDEHSPSWQTMSTTLEISKISASGYKSRHSQPECGYALDPSQWTEYSIHTMDPDNLELTFEFFEVSAVFSGWHGERGAPLLMESSDHRRT